MSSVLQYSTVSCVYGSSVRLSVRQGGGVLKVTGYMYCTCASTMCEVLHGSEQDCGSGVGRYQMVFQDPDPYCLITGIKR